MSEDSITISRGLRYWIITMAAAITLLVVLVVVSAATGEPDHRDLEARLDGVEEQLEYLSCLLVLPDQTPELVAACQIDSGEFQP